MKIDAKSTVLKVLQKIQSRNLSHPIFNWYINRRNGHFPIMGKFIDTPTINATLVSIIVNLVTD